MKLEFHHINFVSKDVSKLHDFYTKILQLENIPMENFPRPKETKNTGYSGEIKVATDGSMQMHLAEKDLNVSAKHNMHINPVEKGHIAFRTDDLKTFVKLLKENQIPYDEIYFGKPWGNSVSYIDDKNLSIEKTISNFLD